jgi:hypothetical protein
MWLKNVLFKQIKFFVVTQAQMRMIDIHRNIMCCLKIYMSSSLMKFEFESERLTFIEASY